MHRLIVLVLLGSSSITLAALGVEGPTTFDYAALVEKQEIRRFFADMVARPLRDLEVAVFIVQNDDGTIAFIPWPVSGEFRGARWDEPVPPNVIAIAHTHPNQWFRASPEDLEQACRTGLPIFILSRRAISVADPSSQRNIVLETSGWMRKVSGAD